MASETFRVRARGDLACFTRPEFKVERVSYEVMTPSAARGVLEAVHWKPAIRWVVTGIHVLAPIEFAAFRRNEVTDRVSTEDARRGMRGGTIAAFLTDSRRAQRNTLALRCVDYVIEAHIVPTGKWGPDDTMAKHAAMFARRLENGQTFHQPYLGCREFVAEVEPAPAELPPTRLQDSWLSRRLGLVLHDLEFGSRIVPLFFEAAIDGKGFMAVPPFAQATPGEPLEREVDS